MNAIFVDPNATRRIGGDVAITVYQPLKVVEL